MAATRTTNWLNYLTMHVALLSMYIMAFYCKFINIRGIGSTKKTTIRFDYFNSLLKGDSIVTDVTISETFSNNTAVDKFINTHP